MICLGDMANIWSYRLWRNTKHRINSIGTADAFLRWSINCLWNAPEPVEECAAVEKTIAPCLLVVLQEDDCRTASEP